MNDALAFPPFYGSGYSLSPGFQARFADPSKAWSLHPTEVRKKNQGIAQNVNLIKDLPGNWTARGQGARGTCTAFAIASCVDILASRDAMARQEFSPEFLYYHMRRDTPPDEQDTVIDWDKGACKLLHAVPVLSQKGICLEADMPYIRRRDDLPEDSLIGPAPPQDATSNAKAHLFEKSAGVDFGSDGTVAQDTVDVIISELNKGLPVTIALPVFKMDNAGLTNWRNKQGEMSGTVFDAADAVNAFGKNTQASALRVSAHAVCIVGYELDASDTLNGTFFFRNSWNGNWGKNRIPRGFGTLPMSYVAQNTIEYLSIKPKAALLS